MGEIIARMLVIALCQITQAIYVPQVIENYKEAVEAEETTGYIYLGDSRFVGMNNTVHMDEKENTFVVAEVGQGLKWFENTAEDEVRAIIENNNEVDKWVLISGLGINDYWNIDKYIEKYDNIHYAFLVLVLVNPVDKDKCEEYGYNYAGLSNGAVEFNDKLIDGGYRYIDTYTPMIECGFSTVDGVHYTEETYQFIYNEIESYLDDHVWRW